MRGRDSVSLHSLAARAMRCHEPLIDVPIDDRVTQVFGCGHVQEYSRALRRRGEDGWTPVEPVGARAAREMQCDEGALSITVDGATARRVEGCGREARYDLMCGATQCAWAMTAHAGAPPPRPDGGGVATAAPIAEAAVEGELYVPSPYRTAEAPVVAPGEPRAGSETRLRALASMALGCSELELTPLRARVVQVLGCGRFGEYASAPDDADEWEPIEPLVDAAAVEMACGEDALTIAALAATTRTAVGCGRSARYELVCGAECAWRMSAHAGAWGETVSP